MKHSKFENFEVNTIHQALNLFLNMIEDIMLSKINVKSSEDSFTEDVIRVFRKKKTKLVGIVGGTTAFIAGAGVAAAGALLIPVTFGGSVGLLASGTVIGTVGATVSFGISIDSLVTDSRMKAPVKKALIQLCYLEKEIVKLIVTANITHEIISVVVKKLSSIEKDIKETNASASTFPSETAERLKSSFKDLTEYQKALHGCHTLSDLGKELSHLAETLKSICMSIIDHVTEYVDAKACPTIEKAFLNPFDYVFQIPESQFILTSIEKTRDEKDSLLAFWLKHLDMGLEGKNESKKEKKLPTYVTFNKQKVLVTKTSLKRENVASLYCDEYSKKFGQKILRFVRAVSAAKLIIVSPVCKEDSEIPGKSNFDFMKKDSEDWPSAFASISDLMIAVKESLNFDQYGSSENVEQTILTL